MVDSLGSNLGDNLGDNFIRESDDELNDFSSNSGKQRVAQVERKIDQRSDVEWQGKKSLKSLT